jgi:hypothetical protein
MNAFKDQNIFLTLLTEILQMNPKPASMFAFSRPSRQTKQPDQPLDHRSGFPSRW